jgi:nucleotide sugar dehydrogenase
MTITVVGLGKIGLPLAVQFARKGENVLGADINQKTVDLVNKGLEPFPEESNLQEYLEIVVNDGKLKASTSTTSCVQNSEVVIVVVPLFVNASAEPDFRAMDSATEDIAKGLQKGTLVAYETTLPIGTTRNRLTKILERISGLTVGEDFSVVFSPERVLTGRVFSDLRKYPKIVGGVTDRCSEIGRAFYSRVLDFDPRKDLKRENGVWVLDSCESAEFVKLAETTYRDVNIGLANQFAKYADRLNLNIYDVIEASNSQPYSHIHQPGIAVGGHCIPIYPQFYLWGDPDASIVRSARRENAMMPSYSISLLINHFNLKQKNLKALIVGVSYRSGVKESAFSGVFSIKDSLIDNGIEVNVIDSSYTEKELIEMNLEPYVGDYSDIDILILHSEIPGMNLILQNISEKSVILDGRNLIRERGFKAIKTKRILILGDGS